MNYKIQCCILLGNSFQQCYKVQRTSFSIVQVTTEHKLSGHNKTQVIRSKLYVTIPYWMSKIQNTAVNVIIQYWTSEYTVNVRLQQWMLEYSTECRNTVLDFDILVQETSRKQDRSIQQLQIQ